MKNLVYITLLLICSVFSFYMGNLDTTKLDDKEVTLVAKEKEVIKQVSVSNDNLQSTEESTSAVCESGEEFKNLLNEVTILAPKSTGIADAAQNINNYANLKATSFKQLKGLKTKNAFIVGKQKMPNTKTSIPTMRKLKSITDINLICDNISVVRDNAKLLGIPTDILARGRSPS